MRLESGNVYENGRGSYMLVFNTTNFGATFAYCNASSYVKDVYANIPELKIDDTIGVVCIDRAIYVPWTKMSTSNFSHCKKLSRRQYILIVNAISALYLGSISLKDNVFEYIDGNSYNENLNTQQMEKHDITQAAVQVEEKQNPIAEEQPTTAESCTSVSRNVNSTKFEPSKPEWVAKAKLAGIPISTENNGKSGERLFDLLTHNTDAKYTGSSNRNFSNNHTKSKNSEMHRHMFTEAECISIACSSISMISEKYNVSKSTASTMLANAKKLFDGKAESKKKKEITVKEIYESGISLDEAILKYKGIVSAGEIKKYYLDMTIDKDNAAAIQKWDKIISDSDSESMKLIISASKSNINDFHIAERCSFSTAGSILCKINKILAFNPLYVVFGDRAYEEDLKDTFNKRACNRNIIDSYVYDIAMRLSDAYTATYNKHCDILHGNYPIPESVADEDKEFFLSMIYNHYNPRMILHKNRMLSRTQKEALESRNLERVAHTFAVQADRARSLIRSYDLRKKRENGK